jgi:hypothetical protein
MAITNSEMQDYARRQCRDGIGGRTNAVINEAINSALLRIAKGLSGPFYDETATLYVYGSYSTGTIAITNGAAAVTLTGGTFPSTLTATWEIRIDGQYYKIASRDSDTQVTLAADWHLTTLTASEYVVYCDRYSLTANMLKIGERLYFGRDWPYGPDPVAYETLVGAKEGGTEGSSRPNLWAVRKDEVVVWPHPTANSVVNYVYVRRPAKVAFDESANLDIDDQHEDLLEAAIDLELAKRGVGIHDLASAYNAYEDLAVLSKGNERGNRSIPPPHWLRGGRNRFLDRTIDTSN